MTHVSENGPGLFAEFPPVATGQWEEQILKDLKGADYEKKLVFSTPEGLKVQPYYRAEHLEGLPFTDTVPGAFPYVRGNHAEGNRWEIRQDIQTDNVQLANTIAVEAVERGAEGIGFNAKAVYSNDDLAQLLKYIELDKTAVHLTAANEFSFVMEQLTGLANRRGNDLLSLRGTLGFDPFSYCLLYGDYYNSLDDNLDEASYLLLKLRSQIPGFRMIHVRGDLFHNAGGTSVQEIAFALASGNEYLSQLTGRGLKIDEVARAMHFTFALGSNYFMEIAKIRAARMLWAAIVRQYHPVSEDSCSMYVHGTTSLWNKTLYDPWVNILRSTTEAMSGAIAGCDTISVTPFDIAYRQWNDFSSRIARNTQIVLREESYLDKVADPAAGSYYIENLTWSMAEAAWELFKKIEGEGGYLAWMEGEKIRKALEESAARKDADIARRSSVILGTNQYPNHSENMLEVMGEAVWKEYPGLRLYRRSMGYENLRLATEKFVAAGSPRPRVFLLTFGNLAMLKARAAFAMNFFGCSGFEVVDQTGFSTPEEGVQAALASGAGIVVLCSSDEEYAGFGAQAATLLKQANPAPITVVAGNPVDQIPQLTAAGVDEFIHVRTNVLESLSQFSKKLGIL
ncbi:MAG TPA: methylmalonyl-CoA mutase family protein [Bacteroidales bacterium]|nr:methylmalonyl-CoA mutase family protein [Bacteroidales bacterium]HRZ48308.1 methylmalonyl-CoA mutase family protein [Bacteroidales bacterium]